MKGRNLFSGKKNLENNSKYGLKLLPGIQSVKGSWVIFSVYILTKVLCSMQTVRPRSYQDLLCLLRSFLGAAAKPPPNLIYHISTVRFPITIIVITTL